MVGVETIELVKHADERGYFMEILRKGNVTFGQWSESLSYQGVIKAWHIHELQTDYWRVPCGVIKAVLCDRRYNGTTFNEIVEYILGDGQKPIVLKIPPGVAHGYKVLQGPALLMYVTDQTYNPYDEGRIPYNDKGIGYDWYKEDIR